MVELSSTADRPGAASLRSRLRDFWFTIDLRSAGLFRILLGLVLVANWVSRWRWLEVLYAPAGVLPATAQAEVRDFFVSQSGAWPALGWWTPLEWLDFSPWAIRAFFLAALGCYAMFLVGYRTRLFGFLSLLAWAAILHRNPYALIGADFVTGSLMLWAQFLPLGARFSIDALREVVGRGVVLPKQRRGDDQPSVPAERRSGFAIAAFGVVLQIGMIYLFTGLWKTVPMRWGQSAAWRDGTAIYYVLHMEQSLYPAALWAREMPLWFLRCMTYGTLALELAALPMLLLPWFQPLLRRAAVLSLMLLHVGIAVTIDAGLFSYVMVASFAVLLTAADWALLKRLIAPFSRPATVYYDDGCGICTRTCEVLAACDRFGGLSFIGSSDRDAYRHTIPAGLTENTVVVFDDRTGRMFTRSRAMAAALRGLPLPYHPLALFALPGVRWISDRGYNVFARHRQRVSKWLGLTACRLPGAAKAPRGEGERGEKRPRRPASPTTASTSAGRGSLLLNVAAGVVLASVLAANVLENMGGLEKHWRQHRHFIAAYSDANAQPSPGPSTGWLSLLDGLVNANEQFNVFTNFSGAIQRWIMFAPDAPREDLWWVADAQLKDGDRIDPMTGRETDFITQPSFNERRYERIWGTYLQYGLGEMRPERFRAAEIIRREFCRYLVESYGRQAPPERAIARIELWLVSLRMPLPARDDAQLSALWPEAGDARAATRVERTIVPRRQSRPYRFGLQIAAYNPGDKSPFESAANIGDRLLPRRNWLPSGNRYGEGPYHLDWTCVVGKWTEWAAGGVYQTGTYVRGDGPENSPKHGLWTVYYPDERRQSEGRYDHDQRQGSWMSYYDDGGEREEVNYVNGQRQGIVRRWYPGRSSGEDRKRKRKEEGQFRDDQPYGLWTYWNPEGVRYQEGFFENGLRHGEWTLWNRQGQLDRQEQYERGLRHGPFAEFYPDGVTILQKGEMREGQPHGLCSKFFASGQLSEEGEYADGLRTGVWKTYYEPTAGKPPQVRKEETYAAGKLEGPTVEYYESGAVKERGEYTVNQRTGLWTAWYPGGKEQDRGEFKGDLQHGPWTFWYETGQKNREGSYAAGREQGEWKSYYDNGAVLMIGPFVDGAPHGRWTIWHRSGKLHQHGEFNAGKQSGHWEVWSEDGTKSAEGDYAAGKKVGPWKTWVKGQETQQTYKDDVLIDAPGAVRQP